MFIPASLLLLLSASLALAVRSKGSSPLVVIQILTFTFLSSSPKESRTHRVYVGVDDHEKSALQYSPSELHAEVGGESGWRERVQGCWARADPLPLLPPPDIVEFHFKPKAHSVTQGSFDHPCIKAAKDAFDTQLIPVNPQTSLIWSPETFRFVSCSFNLPSFPPDLTLFRILQDSRGVSLLSASLTSLLISRPTTWKFCFGAARDSWQRPTRLFHVQGTPR